MSGEIIAILSVGIGLGLLSTGLFAWLRTDLVKVEERLRGNTVKGEERLRADLVTVEERLRANLVTVEERLRGRLGDGRGAIANLVTVEEHLRADIKQLADRVGRLEYGQAKLEGLLEGLREAITGRAAS